MVNRWWNNGLLGNDASETPISCIVHPGRHSLWRCHKRFFVVTSSIVNMFTVHPSTPFFCADCDIGVPRLLQWSIPGDGCWHINDCMMFVKNDFRHHTPSVDEVCHGWTFCSNVKHFTQLLLVFKRFIKKKTVTFAVLSAVSVHGKITVPVCGWSESETHVFYC